MSSTNEFTAVFAGKPNVKLLVEEDVDEMTPKKLGSWVKVDYLGGFHICCAGILLFMITFCSFVGLLIYL